MRRGRSEKGFTLIELLIVVTIIGIIFAIAIPNLLNAIQRARQRRTMGDMRSIATAAEAYAVDTGHYPAAAGYTIPSSLSYPTATINAGTMQNFLCPTYLKLIPMKDGWNSYFLYAISATAQDYIIVSAGKDGITQSGTTVVGPTTNFNEDIVFVDGQFMQWPEGPQN